MTDEFEPSIGQILFDLRRIDQRIDSLENRCEIADKELKDSNDMKK